MNKSIWASTLVFLLTGWASAQSMGGMDLPVTPVRLAAGTQTLDWARYDDDGEDPRDTPPPVFYGEEIDTENDEIVYVIDISGSMAQGQHTSEGSRLARVREELLRSVNGLSENFKFNVVAYGSFHIPFAGGLVQASRENKAALRDWEYLKSTYGMTATGPAMAWSLQAHPTCRAFVLLTDGSPNYGVDLMSERPPGAVTLSWITMESHQNAHRKVIRNANRQRATIDVFGVQTYGSTRAFCQGVASDSGGSFTDVP